MSLVIKTDKEPVEKKLAPHLAITHNELQHGAANGRNVSLLLKADNLDDETKAILKRVLGEVETEEQIEKASYNNLRRKLNDAVQKFSKERWSWAYVEDFDENVVVFSNSDGVYYVNYSLSGDEIVMGDEALSVNRFITYEDKSGNIVLTESDAISNSVKSLIVKSFDSIASNEKIVDIFKSKYMEGKEMNELQKTVEDLQKSLSDVQAELLKAKEEKQAALDALEAIEKAAAEAKSAERLEKLKEVTAESEVETLHKSLSVLSDEDFTVVLKAMQAKKEALEDSDLFKKKSVDGEETKDSKAKFTEMLKKQYEKQ